MWIILSIVDSESPSRIKSTPTAYWFNRSKNLCKHRRVVGCGLTPQSPHGHCCPTHRPSSSWLLPSWPLRASHLLPLSPSAVTLSRSIMMMELNPLGSVCFRLANAECWPEKRGRACMLMSLAVVCSGWVFRQAACPPSRPPQIFCRVYEPVPAFLAAVCSGWPSCLLS